MADPRVTRRPRRASARLLAAAGLAVLLVGGSAAPAFAHNYLVGSTPTAGSVVTVQPEVVSVTTNDNLLDFAGDGSGSAIQVSGPADAPRYYGDGCATISGPTLSSEVQLGQPGEYTVVWQVVSTDGHPISDSFTFTWQPDADQVLAAGAADAPACGTAADTGVADTDPTTDAAAGDDGGIAVTDLFWIGGALLAVLVAIGVTLLVLRRRPTP